MKKYDVSLETLTEATIAFKNFLPGLIEKSKIHIYNGDWEQALETIQKVLIQDNQNVEALRIYVFYLISRETDVELIVEKLEELLDSMKR